MKGLPRMTAGVRGVPGKEIHVCEHVNIEICRGLESPGQQSYWDDPVIDRLAIEEPATKIVTICRSFEEMQ